MLFRSSNVIGIQPPKTTVIWGKRQDESELPEEEFPEEEWPEEPEEPFPFPAPTPSNVIDIQPPKTTVIWGKRQDDGTEEPELPEEEFPEEEWPEEPEDMFGEEGREWCKTAAKCVENFEKSV